MPSVVKGLAELNVDVSTVELSECLTNVPLEQKSLTSTPSKKA